MKLSLLSIIIMACPNLSSWASIEDGSHANVRLELFDCAKDETSIHCQGTGLTYGNRVIKLESDSSKPDYAVFWISDDKVLSVKIAGDPTKASSPSFFLRSSLTGFNPIQNAPLFITGESILEVDPRKSLKSLQVYSPNFELKGATKMARVTITF